MVPLFIIYHSSPPFYLLGEKSQPFSTAQGTSLGSHLHSLTTCLPLPGNLDSPASWAYWVHVLYAGRKNASSSSSPVLAPESMSSPTTRVHAGQLYCGNGFEFPSLNVCLWHELLLNSPNYCFHSRWYSIHFYKIIIVCVCVYTCHGIEQCSGS